MKLTIQTYYEVLVIFIMTNRSEWKWPSEKHIKIRTLCILSKFFSTDHLESWNPIKNTYKNENLFFNITLISENLTFLLKDIKKNVNSINIKIEINFSFADGLLVAEAVTWTDLLSGVVFFSHIKSIPRLTHFF